MAKLTVKGADEFALKLSKLETGSAEIAKKAIYAGAGIVADEIRKSIEAIPEDKFRFLRGSDSLASVSKTQKKELADSLGISTIDEDENSDWSAAIGFGGYLDVPGTKKYTKGLPAVLLARSLESGSSVRRKHPFVRPAVNRAKAKAKAEIGRIVDEETQKIMGGK